MTEWLGFYGPSYRELLRASAGLISWEDAWNRALVLHHANPADERHWEFLATGYLHLVDHSGAALDSVTLQRLAHLEHLFQRSPRTNNWRLMQILARRRLEGRLLGADDLLAAHIVPQRNGYLPDGDREDPTTQYHAYIALLALRFGDRADPRLAHILEHGLDWLYGEDRAYGDPSALGRGRFQLFGYASMAACASLAPRWSIAVEPAWHARVLRRAVPGDADRTLADAWTGPHRSLLVHGYNTTSDYSAFAELWASSPERIRPPEVTSSQLWWHPLGNGSSGVIANSSGALVAVLRRDTHLRPSRRAALRSLVDVAIRRCEHAPSALDSRGASVAGVHITASKGRLRIRSNCTQRMHEREFRSPIIWVRGRAKAQLHGSGCVEVEEFTWGHRGVNEWTGTAFRIVRHGQVELECEL